MNAVKRIIFLLVLLIPFCLAGCSSDDDEGDNGGEGPNEDAPVSYVHEYALQWYNYSAIC